MPAMTIRPEDHSTLQGVRAYDSNLGLLFVYLEKIRGFGLCDVESVYSLKHGK